MWIMWNPFYCIALPLTTMVYFWSAAYAAKKSIKYIFMKRINAFDFIFRTLKLFNRRPCLLVFEFWRDYSVSVENKRFVWNFFLTLSLILQKTLKVLNAQGRMNTCNILSFSLTQFRTKIRFYICYDFFNSCFGMEGLISNASYVGFVFPFIFHFSVVRTNINF